MEGKPRSDTGTARKITPEELLEAINQVLPCFRGTHYNKMDVYRKIIEKGILSSALLAQTTFYRFIREFELLSDRDASQNKRRLAFAMQYAANAHTQNAVAFLTNSGRATLCTALMLRTPTGGPSRQDLSRLSMMPQGFSATASFSRQKIPILSSRHSGPPSTTVEYRNRSMSIMGGYTHQKR